MTRQFGDSPWERAADLIDRDDEGGLPAVITGLLIALMALCLAHAALHGAGWLP